MTILRDISFLWSMIHLIVLFLILFEPRYSWRTTVIAGFTGSAVLALLNVLIMVLMGAQIIMRVAFFSCTIPSLLLFFALSRYRDGRFFFLFCMTDTMCFWMLQLTNLLDRLAWDNYVLMFITRLLIFPAAELLFWRRLRRPYKKVQSQEGLNWWLFAAMGATYYLLMMFTSVPVGTPIPDAAGLGRILLVMVLMPLTYLVIIRSLYFQMQDYEVSRQMELQRRDYESVCQKMELGRAYRHDMRHHLTTIRGMLAGGDTEGAQAYVEKLGSGLAESELERRCANAAVNAVLGSYAARAKSLGCEASMDVLLPEKLPVEETELCVLLSNALENAVNELQKIPRREDRSFAVSARIKGGGLAICVSNVCAAPVELDAQGFPVTQPREGHGIGLRSIESTVKKYNGIFSCRMDGKEFKLEIVLFGA